ncbi:MAG: gamma-glutamyl-gamma-aminobutyrate hydrolase family protein [Deltaproteobacteria bacterium]|nr:gamma-glutamyl-gamma-aminobutyrate hydrolase family protein [Deltaproteobacteria bacterium]
MSGAPIIGITADWADATPFREPTVFLHHRYCREVERAGGVPLILPPGKSTKNLDHSLDRIDGLIISGGDFDIHPRHYGEKPIAKLGDIIPERTEFELELILRALRRDLPILGICGGAQAINVVLGGSLYQDIATQVPNAVSHRQSKMKERGGHSILVTAKTLLARAVTRRVVEVNTTHHQAIKNAGKNLLVSAQALDGLTEAVESTNHAFVLGVQWHPEVLAPKRADQRRIFSLLIAACRG